MRRMIVATLLFVFPLSLLAAPRALDSAEIAQALKKLTVVGSALYVAAHPDDENTAMIAWLSRDRLYRTGYLAMTRGDGGQNLLGDEKGDLLGVIRTQELLAARHVDGGEQFFTRAIDFGFSKNPTETLGIWGHDVILADVVWVIRRFQPDVIITRFPTTGEGGHGHHTASAILAVEAFKAAGDPTRFPEQLQYVHPWQARRIFWNRFSFQAIEPSDPKVANSFRVDLGALNHLLGRAYTEIAAESRSMHKSQGFGAAERRGTAVNYFDILAGDSPTGDARTADLFEGIDTSWSRYPGGEAVGKLVQQAADTFDPKEPQKTLPLLLQAYAALNRLGASGPWSPSSTPWISVKRDELTEIIRACAGVAIDVNASSSSVTAGGETKVTVTVVNRSDYPFSLSTVASIYAESSKAPGTRLLNNVPVKTELTIKPPADLAASQPYWLDSAPTKGAFTVPDQRLIGLAENAPAIPLTVTLTDPDQHAISFSVPAVYRWTDAVLGEQTRRVDVIPDVTANLGSHVYLFPDARAKPVSIWLRNFGGPGTVKVRVIVPPGWSADPPAQTVTFANKGDDAHVTFAVTPPRSASSGDLHAEIELANGRKITAGMTEINYPHIPAQRIFAAALAHVVREDIRKIGSRIGYIMGSGDEVPDALRQIGYEVTLLTDADLERGDFARFDTIVTGVRAYNARAAMKGAHSKLMKYVENGGTLVVQYNSLNPQPLLVSPPGPYPFKVTDARVTVEEAPMTILDAASPLLNTPNKIVPSDFDGWVQERAVYMSQEWDPRYATVMATNDPAEPQRAGGELYTRYGKGIFIYTSFAWFRQLPAGVPGAYKMFANLVSAR